MAVQRALVHQALKVAKLIPDAPVPALRPDRVKVKNVAVALNPTDWKGIDFVGSKGAIVGCDFAGVIEEVGANVKEGFKVGDRVAGFVHGGNQSDHGSGCFAEYTMAAPQILAKIPSSMSFEEASTLGCGLTTVGQAMYQSLGLPLPSEPASTPTPLLIYGGSTATGTLAIQFAKLSGLTVYTTCSPHNFDLVKRYGADHVFNYKSPTVGAEIRSATNDSLHHALDCVAFENTAAICAEALSSKGGQYSSLLRVEKFPRKDIEAKSTLAYTGFGETFRKGDREWPAQKDHLEFQGKFWALVGELLEQGKIKPHPLEVREGGLDGILKGLEDMKADRISGVKLVYRV